MIYNYKYFFLYISVYILLLTIPLSSAHNKPNPPGDNTNKPPCKCNEDSPSPPSNGNKAPPSPSKVNVPTPPPPSRVNVPTPPPPSRVNVPTPPPPSRVNVPTPPPPSKVPSTPPAGKVPSTPPAGKVPSTPPTGKVPSTPPAGSKPPSNESYGGCFNKVYAFGDSYTDTGNAQLLGGLKNFVVSFFSHFHNGPLHGIHNLPGFRQCNGRLLVDFLCEDLKLPYLPPYKKTPLDFSAGVNFAVSGATAFHADFFLKHNLSNHNLMWKGAPLNFQTQIEWFNRYILDTECKGKTDGDCRAHIGESLFWVGDMGGNDYSRFLGSVVGSMKSLTETTVKHVTGVVHALIERGAKYIVVQGLPPIGCCPLELSLAKSQDRDPMGCLPVINSVIQAHNDLLQKNLENLRANHKHCTILYADMWQAYKTVVSNPRQYNFAEPFKACCGAGGGPLNFKLHTLCGSVGTTVCKDPASHIFWDGIHFTEAMHSMLAKLFFQHTGYTSPISFSEMIAIKKRNMGPVH